MKSHFEEFEILRKIRHLQKKEYLPLERIKERLFDSPFIAKNTCIFTDKMCLSPIMVTALLLFKVLEEVPSHLNVHLVLLLSMTNE